MVTQKQRAKWFKDLYEIYYEEFNEDSEIGECPMDEAEFNCQLKDFVKNDWESFK